MSKAYNDLLHAPAAYVRDDDGAEMLRLKPHFYVSRKALATILSPSAPVVSPDRRRTPKASFDLYGD